MKPSPGASECSRQNLLGSRLPFGSLRYAFAPLRSALTRKFLPALCEASGDGCIRHWRKGGESDGQIHHHPGVRGPG